MNTVVYFYCLCFVWPLFIQPHMICPVPQKRILQKAISIDTHTIFFCMFWRQTYASWIIDHHLSSCSETLPTKKTPDSLDLYNVSDCVCVYVLAGHFQVKQIWRQRGQTWRRCRYVGTVVVRSNGTVCSWNNCGATNQNQPLGWTYSTVKVCNHNSTVQIARFHNIYW